MELRTSTVVRPSKGEIVQGESFQTLSRWKKSEPGGRSYKAWWDDPYWLRWGRKLWKRTEGPVF